VKNTSDPPPAALPTNQQRAGMGFVAYRLSMAGHTRRHEDFGTRNLGLAGLEGWIDGEKKRLHAMKNGS